MKAIFDFHCDDSAPSGQMMNWLFFLFFRQRIRIQRHMGSLLVHRWLIHKEFAKLINLFISIIEIRKVEKPLHSSPRSGKYVTK